MSHAITTTVPARPVPRSPVAAPLDGPARPDAAVRLGAGAGLWLSLLLVAWWWAAWLRTRPGRGGLVVSADGSTTLVDGPGPITTLAG